LRRNFLYPVHYLGEKTASGEKQRSEKERSEKERSEKERSEKERSEKERSDSQEARRLRRLTVAHSSATLYTQ
jgi:hypothetical protein